MNSFSYTYDYNFVSAVVLMSGIVLVTKPSFLFSLNNSDELIEDSFNLNTSNVLIKENETGI